MTAGRFRLGPWEVHPAAHRLVRLGPGGEESLRLEPRVMALLVSLAERPGEVVSREELFETVWEGAFVGDEALTTAVYQLRRALGDDARRARYVETVSKGGYRLLAPLDPLPRGSDALRPGATGSQTGARSPARPAGLDRRGPVLRWAAALAGPLLVAALALARLGPASGPGASSIPEPRPTPASLPPSPTTGPAGAEIAAAAELREGWRSLERPGRDAVAEALARFERAVSLEPRDPLAHAGLAEALARARGLGLAPLGETEPRARAAAVSAVALGPELAASHRALAYVRLTLDWDCAGAEAALDRALALEPSDPRVHSLLAQLHFVAGRREAALAAIERARRLAPESPGIQGLAGTLAAVLGRPELAERAYLRALALDPAAEEPLRGLEKLRSAREEALRGAPPDTDFREGLDRLASMASEGPVPPSHLAALYAEIGDERQALDWLDRAWRDRDPGLFFLRYDSRWQPYRDHPRVRELLERLSTS